MFSFEYSSDSIKSSHYCARKMAQASIFPVNHDDPTPPASGETRTETRRTLLPNTTNSSVVELPLLACLCHLTNTTANVRNKRTSSFQVCAVLETPSCTHSSACILSHFNTILFACHFLLVISAASSESMPAPSVQFDRRRSMILSEILLNHKNSPKVVSVPFSADATATLTRLQSPLRLLSAS